jgi:septum formation topological specificity factor MinE
VTENSLVYIIGSGVVAALTTVVGVLWRKQEKGTEQNRLDLIAAEERTRKDLDECRNDRQRLWNVITELKTEIAGLIRGGE